MAETTVYLDRFGDRWRWAAGDDNAQFQIQGSGPWHWAWWRGASFEDIDSGFGPLTEVSR